MIKDAGRAAALLDLVEKVANVAPGFSHISSEAMAELRLINEGIRKAHEEESGLPITPATVGDAESPKAPSVSAQGGDQYLVESIASTPTDKKIDSDTAMPKVSPVEDRSAPTVDESKNDPNTTGTSSARMVPSTPDQPDLPNLGRRL